MMKKLVPILIAAGLAGCAGSYRGSVYATSSGPDMAYVAPGVRVIADYDEPIFFADGFYWYNSNGYWYRSHSDTNGWAYVERPPRAIISINRPYAYAHYRPNNYVVHRRPVPIHRFERPVVRDHRAARRGGYYRTR